MNYLAHAYLSFGLPGVLTGNMISDYVKGRKKFDYPEEIQRGISLHRSIDQFTDAHPVVKEAKAYFRADYRLYAGAFVDVAFDHFLASEEEIFTEEGLQQFSSFVYFSLDQYQSHFPERFARMYPFMKQQNWLLGYRSLDGVRHSFGGLIRRTAYLTDPAPAWEAFQLHYQPLQAYFRLFWPELRQFAFGIFQNG